MASPVSALTVSSSTIPDGPYISEDYAEFLGLGEGIDVQVGTGATHTVKAVESTVPIVTDTDTCRHQHVQVRAYLDMLT